MENSAYAVLLAGKDNIEKERRIYDVKIMKQLAIKYSMAVRETY